MTRRPFPILVPLVGGALAVLVAGAAVAAPTPSAPPPFPAEVVDPMGERDADAPVTPPLATTAPADGGDIIPGEIAVDLRDDLAPADIAALARDLALTLTPNSPWSESHDKLEVARVAPTDVAATIARLSRDPRVEIAEPMGVVRASFTPNDPEYAKQWHLRAVGAERAWEYACGAGVTVAVVDTGVACYDDGPFSRASDLGGTRCVPGYNFVDGTSRAADDHGHGTHVAGTIAQTTHNGKEVAGLAHCARLMPVKVLSRSGSGTTAGVAEGIRFAADNGAQVINLSLGGGSRSRILEAAVRHAIDKGVVVVAAAGNTGGAVQLPAAYDGVIAVSATDSKGKLAYFSSRGPEIAIAAPGVNVTQQTVCKGGRDKCEVLGNFSGTSMAAPHVAGAAALLMSVGVTHAGAVRSTLLRSAVRQDDRDQFGAGILDANAGVGRVFWWHNAMRLALLFVAARLVARRIRKRGGPLGAKMKWTRGVVLGALLGGLGLVPFVPLLHVAPRLGGARWVAELLMRPVGEWDLVLGTTLHRWLPLASALPALALAALFFGSKRLRGAIGGYALGAAALLGQLAISAEVAAPFGSLALRLWAVVNIAVCLWLARLALDRKA